MLSPPAEEKTRMVGRRHDDRVNAIAMLSSKSLRREMKVGPL